MSVDYSYAKSYAQRYTVRKKQYTGCFVITLANVIRFAKFLTVKFRMKRVVCDIDHELTDDTHDS